MLLGTQGLPGISTYPASAQSEFVEGRLGGVRAAADVTVRTAGRRGTPTAFALEADTPAYLRKGRSGTLRAQSDVVCNVLTPRYQVAEAPSRVNEMGPEMCTGVKAEGFVFQGGICG